MTRILIVGSGITGSAVKFFLSNLLLGESNSTISIWEASHTAGGRMQTDRLFGDHRCDLGAQYISQNVGGLLEGLDVYDHLINHKALDLIKDNNVVNGMRSEHVLGQHYIAATGTTNMTASLADGASIEFGKNVVGLEVESGAGKLQVLSSDPSPEAFDVVVLTVPAPQSMKILQHKLPDGTKLVPSAILESLQQVRYSSRFALAAYFEFPSAHTTQSVLDSVPWRAKYVFDDDVIRYVSIENFKYEQLTQECTSDNSNTDANKGESKVYTSDAARHILSILVHTSVPYGLAHPEVLSYCSPQAFKDMRKEGVADLEQRKQEVISTILERLVKPTALPALSGYAPLRTRLVGWEQSQVSRGYYAGVSAGTGTTGGSGSAGTGADNSRGVIDSAGEVIALPAAVVLSTAAVHVDPSVKLHVVSEGPEEMTNANSRKGSTAPLLVLAGDAFTESNFDGCIKSARYAAQAIVKHLESKKC